MEHCKLQIGCLIIVIFIAFTYYKEQLRYKKNRKPVFFDYLLLLCGICIIFDGITAYTVNHLDTVNKTLNKLLHLIFLSSIDLVIFMLFYYMLYITECIPKNRWKKLFIFAPFAINIAVVVFNIGSLEYRIGSISNYSMGVSAYTCFIMVGIYIIFTALTFFSRRHYINAHKRANIDFYLFVLTTVAYIQMLIPELLITSIGITILILGVYLNQENPALWELEHYHNEMVIGFATLIENKDCSTGGHIKRTTMYVKLLANELRSRGYYKNILTSDYINNLIMSAPMHDIGKIAIPDVILQKPDKLTDEEFEVMKTHAASGGKIIEETFGGLGNEAYREIAYNVAMHHHEKWNGEGYPSNLKGEDIPLCARIMAIADVFDAVSEDRCYRAALPLDECFDIIRRGSGKDFDPLLAQIFLEIRDKVEREYNLVVPHKSIESV